MDSNGLRYFATHSLNHESRNILAKLDKAVLPDAPTDSHLSKFGVGAKQAGFFLGSRIRVITRQKSQTQVKQLVIDEKVLDERFETSGTTK